MFYTSKCLQDLTLAKEHAPYRLLYEAVFELKEAGFKLDVTKWVPRLTQSVTVYDLKMALLQFTGIEKLSLQFTV